MTSTELSYGPTHNQIIEQREFDYGGKTVLRTTRTQYESNSGFMHRHLLSLPKTIEVFGGSDPRILARTEYVYDGQPLIDTPGVVNHLRSHNPQARTWIPEKCEFELGPDGKPRQVCEPGHWDGDYDPTTQYRGNVTQIRQQVDTGMSPQFQVEARRYDITGNLISISRSPGEETRFTHTLATQYAYPEALTRGAADTNSQARVRTTAAYNLNTGLMESSSDANGRERTILYDGVSLRPKSFAAKMKSSSSNDYTINYSYDNVAMTTAEAIIDSSTGNVAGHTITRLNGRGQVRETKVLTNEGLTGQNGQWDETIVQYDAMGRRWKQSLPHRTGQVLQWTELFYDGLGRVAVIQSADGSLTRHFYNEVARPNGASANPGQTVRSRDAWGRERWSRTNALGQIQEVAEPSAKGTGSVFEENASIASYN